MENCENETDNPIIMPCKCMGTMKYVHLECFKNWIKKQVLVKSSTNLISYYWKKLQCELCQDTINHELIANEHKFQLVDLPKIDDPHVILESYMNDKSKGFHIIKFSENKNQIKLGRGFNCDIRINDISVSRLHALIKLEKGHFYLQDSSSKFGTLLLMQKPQLSLDQYKDFSVQVGRTLLEFKVTKSSTGFFSKKKKSLSTHSNSIQLEVSEPTKIKIKDNSEIDLEVQASSQLGSQIERPSIVIGQGNVSNEQPFLELQNPSSRRVSPNELQQSVLT